MRLDLPQILYLSANVTLVRDDAVSITVTGNLEAHIKSGEYLDPEIIISDFDTLILDTSTGNAGISIEEATDYDDEVSPTGEIDVGEIVSQYLSLELF